MHFFRAKKSRQAFLLLHQVLPRASIEYPEFMKDCLPDSQPTKRIQLTQSLYTSIIAGLASRSFLDLARTMLEKADSFGFKKSARMYNALIQGYFQTTPVDFKQGVYFIKAMKKRGFIPNTYTYLSMMNALCDSGRMVDAQEVLNNMISDGHRLSLPIYSLIVRTHLKLDGPVTKLDILTHMLRNNISPDSKFFATWLRVLVKEQRMDHACNIFQLSKQYIEPSKYMYSIIIKGFVDQNDMFSAETWFQEMMVNGHFPTRITYSTLMHGWIKQRNKRNALVWFGKMIGFDFENHHTIHVNNEAIADIGGIYPMLSFLMQESDWETLSYAFRISTALGFTLPNNIKAKLMNQLFLNGFIWPAVFIPQMKACKRYPNNTLDFFDKALLLLDGFQSVSTSTDDITGVISKLKTIIDSRISQGPTPVWLQIQWICVELLNSNQEFDQKHQVIACQILKLLLMKIVRIQIDDSTLPLSTTKLDDIHDSIDEFINSYITDQVFDQLKSVNVVRPLHRPKVKKLYAPSNLTKLKKQTEKEKLVPHKIETVSTIATSMFPAIANCVGLYREIKDGLTQRSQKDIAPSQVDTELLENEPRFTIPGQHLDPIPMRYHRKLQKIAGTRFEDDLDSIKKPIN